MMSKRMLFLFSMISIFTFGAMQAVDKVDTPVKTVTKPIKMNMTLDQNIQKALMLDGKLSTAARNIKVSSDDGKVILKGKVMDADEMAVVIKKVQEVKGVKTVDGGQLEMLKKIK